LYIVNNFKIASKRSRETSTSKEATEK